MKLNEIKNYAKKVGAGLLAAVTLLAGSMPALPVSASVDASVAAVGVVAGTSARTIALSADNLDTRTWTAASEGTIATLTVQANSEIVLVDNSATKRVTVQVDSDPAKVASTVDTDHLFQGKVGASGRQTVSVSGSSILYFNFIADSVNFGTESIGVEYKDSNGSSANVTYTVNMISRQKSDAYITADAGSGLQTFRSSSSSNPILIQRERTAYIKATSSGTVTGWDGKAAAYARITVGDANLKLSSSSITSGLVNSVWANFYSDVAGLSTTVTVTYYNSSTMDEATNVGSETFYVSVARTAEDSLTDLYYVEGRTGNLVFVGNSVLTGVIPTIGTQSSSTSSQTSANPYGITAFAENAGTISSAMDKSVVYQYGIKLDLKVDTEIRLNTRAAGEVTYTAGNSSYFTVDENGTLKAVRAGTTYLIVNAAGDGTVANSSYQIPVLITETGNDYFVVTYTDENGQEVDVIRDQKGNIDLDLSGSTAANAVKSVALNIRLKSGNTNMNAPYVVPNGIVGISGAGTAYTATAGLVAGKATVNLSSAQNTTLNVNGVSGSFTITVNDLPANKILVDSPIRLNLTDKKSANIVAQLEYEDAAQKSGMTYVASPVDEADNEGVVTVDSSGRVTAKKYGTETITITAPKSTSHRETKTEIQVIVAQEEADTASHITVPADKSLITVTGTKTDTIGATATNNATISYQSANEEIATVDQTGTVTGVFAGKTTITLTTENGGSAVVTVLVKPRKGKIKSLVSSTAGTFTVTQTKRTGSTGYKIYYATTKTKLKNSPTVVKVTSPKATTISDLISKQAYYVQVRAYYKGDDGTSLHGTKSAVMKIKVK